MPLFQFGINGNEAADILARMGLEMDVIGLDPEVVYPYSESEIKEKKICRGRSTMSRQFKNCPVLICRILIDIESQETMHKGGCIDIARHSTGA